MTDLNHVAQRYSVSMDSLRHFAFTNCQIPATAPLLLLDLWLYERLAATLDYSQAYFNIEDAVGLRNAILSSLMLYSGSFEERCAQSWADLQSRPVVCHEPPAQCYCLPWSGDLWQEGGAVHEYLFDDGTF